MRQIGVRDEARIVGGLGHCGQELCCKRLGGEFNPVSIQALGGFVSEEKRGPLCNPHGDHRPLAHPAAEGVGVLAGQLFLLPEVKTAQGCDSPGESLLFG